MFKKLLKYDMRAVSKLWWIGVVVSLGASVIGSMLIKLFIYIVESDSENPIFIVLAFFGVIAAMACIFAVPLSFVFTIVLVFARFYKHLFTDEGYLTFTLPVNRSTILLSKTVNAIIWLAAHLVIIIISIFFMVCVFGAPEGMVLSFEAFKEIGEDISQAWSDIGAWFIVYAIEALIGIFLILLFLISLVHFCIAFGALLVKKAKLITAIGIYYAFSSVLTVIAQLGILFLGSLIEAGAEYFMEGATKAQECGAHALLALVLIAIVGAVISVIYSITQYMLDRKLNLA